MAHADALPRRRRPFPERLKGALMLDASVYEEVEHDPQALGQAALVVGLAAIAQALGSAGVGGFWGPMGAVVSGFLGWLLGTALVWLIGVKWLGHSSDYMELLRTLGFASAPKLLLVLTIVPILSALVWIGVLLLTLAAFVVAVRHALDVTTERAILVCLAAAGASILLSLLGIQV